MSDVSPWITRPHEFVLEVPFDFDVAGGVQRLPVLQSSQMMQAWGVNDPFTKAVIKNFLIVYTTDITDSTSGIALIGTFADPNFNVGVTVPAGSTGDELVVDQSEFTPAPPFTPIIGNDTVWVQCNGNSIGTGTYRCFLTITQDYSEYYLFDETATSP